MVLWGANGTGKGEPDGRGIKLCVAALVCFAAGWCLSPWLPAWVMRLGKLLPK